MRITQVTTTFITALVLISMTMGLLMPALLTPSQAYAATVDTTQKGQNSIDTAVASLGSHCSGWWSLVTLNLNCIILNTVWLIDEFLAGTVLYFASQLLDWSVEYNLVSITGENNTFVHVGWGLIRDIANLFFIFVLLWIALATIFDISGYGGKELLGKLVIAALLVNFSLAIGGFVINVSNALARAFYNPIRSGSLGEKLIKFTNIQAQTLSANPAVTVTPGMFCPQRANKESGPVPKGKVGDPSYADRLKAWNEKNDTAFKNCMNSTSWVPLPEESALIQKLNEGTNTAILNATYQALWLIIIIPVLAFVLGAGAIFLLMRYLMLTMLLIFGPLVFLFSVLPITRGYISQWWSKLFQWSFFAPAFFFLLFLTIEGFQRLQIINARTPSRGFTGIGFDMILFIALMILNLQLAQKMGIYGANTVVGFGKKQTDKLKGAVRGAAYRGYIRGIGAPAGRALTESGLGRAMARTPFLRGVLNPAMKIQEEKDRLDAERAKQVERAAALSPDLAASRFRGESAGVQAALMKSGSAESIRRLMSGMDAGERARVVANLHANRLATRLDENALAQKMGEAMAKDAQGLSLRVTAATGVREGDAGFAEAFTNHMDSLNDQDFAKAITPAAIEGSTAFIRYMQKNMTGDRRWIEGAFGSPDKIRAFGRAAEATAAASHHEGVDAYRERKDARITELSTGPRANAQELRKYRNESTGAELKALAETMRAEGNDAGYRSVSGNMMVRALLTNSKRELYVEAERRNEEGLDTGTSGGAPSRAPTMTERVRETPTYAGEVPPTPPPAPPSAPPAPPRPTPPAPVAPPASPATPSAPPFSPTSGGTAPLRASAPTKATPETVQPDIISFANDPRREARKMREQLKRLEYGIEDLQTMTEERAQEIIRGQRRKATRPTLGGGGTPPSPESEKTPPSPQKEELPPPIG